MNGTVGTLTIEMAANIVRLQQDMDKAKKTVDSAMGSVESSINRVTTALGAIAGALSVQAFTTKLIQVQREFDILNSSLITVTGSSRNAEIEFAWIKNFAATTPFSLAEVTSAFIKMKALGLDASAEALKSYGNTASAMGKSLDQLIEAVADAATGEFERLKEFGIKANAEGDRVTLTFRGVSTNIGKNAAEITQYLRSIGEVDFAGAMENRANTLDGAISNLGDTWDELFRTINKGLFGDILLDSVRGLTTLLSGLGSGITTLGDAIERNKTQLMIWAAIFTGGALLAALPLITAAVGALTTGVIALSAAFAANPVALAIMAVTAAAVPAVNAISAMVAENKKAETATKRVYETEQERAQFMEANASPTQAKQIQLTKDQIKEIEKQEEAYKKLIEKLREQNAELLLEESNNGKLTAQQRQALTVMLDIQNGTLKLTDAQKRQVATSLEQLIATEKVTDEAKKQYEAFKKLTDSIEDKTKELQIDLQTTGKLTDAQKLAYKTMLDLQSGTLKLTDAQKEQIAASLEQLLATDKLNEELKQQEEYLKAVAKETMSFLEAQDKKLESLTEDIEKQKEANRELELGKEAVESLRVEKIRETAASLDRKAALLLELGLDGEIAQSYRDQAQGLRELAALKEQGIHVQAAKDAADEWKKTSDSITESLTDALLRGFESGKDFGQNLMDTLKNMFSTLVLRPIIQPVAQGMANVVLGAFGMGAGGNASAASGAMGTFNVMSGLKSAYDAITGSFASLGNSISFAAQDIGAWLVSNTTGALNSAGASLMTNAGAIGTGASYLGGAAAGYGIGTAISGKYEAFGDKNIATVGGTVIGAILGGPIGAAIGGAIGGVINRAFGMGPKETTNAGITGTLSAGGANLQSFNDWLKEGGWFRSDKSGREFQALGTELNAFLDGSVKMVAAATKDYAKIVGLNADAIDVFSQQIEISLKGLTAAEQEQAIAKAIQEFQDNLTAQIGAALVPFQLAGETLTQTLVRLAEIQIVSEQLNQFGGAFSNFATASVTARQSIIELAGGIEQLVQKAQGFIANFYTREEQAAITARGVVTALAQAGFTEAQIAALETKADFRSLLESIDVSTEIGQKQFVTLLDMQQMYADMIPIMEEQKVSLLELIEAAPQVEILQKMFETDAAYQTRVQSAEEAAQVVFDSMLQQLGALDVSVNNIGTIIGNGLSRIELTVSSAIQTASSQAAAAQAQAAAAIAAAQFSASLALASQVDMNATGFAMGGYMSGPALVGEHGPEIFNPQTSQVYTAPATANMIGGGDVAAEIRALRDEVSLMRSETRATAVNTSKMVRLQDNWDVRGLTVKTDVDQPLETVAA